MSWSSRIEQANLNAIACTFSHYCFCMLIPVGLIIKMEDVKAEADGQALSPSTSDRDMQEQ